jgi:hypothetical protein
MRVVISDDADERQQAYEQSHIRIWHTSAGLVTIEPRPAGAIVGEFPEASDTTIHVITAQNPGRQLSDDENNERQIRLWDRLREHSGVRVCLAEGGDPEWTHREASFAVVGLTDDEAQALGGEFDQEAVFAWRSDELVVLSCRYGS